MCSKKRALSRTVCAESSTVRVRESSGEPGSVECYVPVGADAKNLEVYAASVGDPLLVIAVNSRKMHLLRSHGRGLKQVLPHEVVVALWVTGFQSQVFIQIECGDL